jgi:hypothetical protein
MSTGTMIAGANQGMEAVPLDLLRRLHTLPPHEILHQHVRLLQAGVTANVTGCTLSKGCGECA